ncbi:MAG TPA: FAD-dependent oxidoreductase, partial [Verrucomicrobiae bacterium]|nr:FAD-dependent oxidoreductase [Verrucomicrobiae bacterium]
MIECDVCIIGAGIAGVSLAAQLAPHKSVVVIDQEAHAGYHATGRSVAIFTHALPGSLVAPLTRASVGFFTAGNSVTSAALQRPRPVLQFGVEQHADALMALHKDLASGGGRARLCYGAEVRALVSILRQDQASIAVIDEDAFEVDVDALLQGCLRQAKARSAQFFLSAPLASAERISSGWLLRAGDEQIRAQVLVNAAGAWGDEVAQIAAVQPLGLEPRRRTVA